MTRDREAMTLKRQAFEKWASDKLLGGDEKRIAWLTWQAAIAYLSRATEPVGVVDSLIGSHGGFSHAVFKASNVPVGTKLYAHPSEDVRDTKCQEGPPRAFQSIGVPCGNDAPGYTQPDPDAKANHNG